MEKIGRRWTSERKRLAPLLLSMLTITGFGFWVAPGLPTAATTPAAGGGPVEIAPAFEPVAGTVDLGPLPADTSLTLVVGLASSDPAGLELAAAGRGHLAANTVSSLFGAPQGQVDAASAYFASFGLLVRPSPDHLLLLVQRPASGVAQAFHTSFEQYASGGRQFYSHTSVATLPGGLPWTGAVGLGTQHGPRPQVASSFAGRGNIPLGSCTLSFGLTPCDFENAYNSSGLLGLGTNGTGFTIGVVDTYDSNETQNSLAGDLARFAQNYSLPVGTVHFLYPVPTTKNLNRTQTGWGVEEALDLEWSRGAAPGATLDMTFAPDAFAGLYAAVDWLVAHQAVNVISLSWGEPDVGVYNAFQAACQFACNATSDGSYSLLHPVLAAAAAEGIGV
ncbi:MAG TPA: protease pro-enzyme activation domain-containing protein, partial [Thermoplasmata archaeon]|nr:protease pro-enzyme activation domain-containing protein [Thermoplasmata archaeon]